MRLYKLSLLVIVTSIWNLGSLLAEDQTDTTSPIEIGYDKRVELTMTVYLLATEEDTQHIEVIHPLKQTVTDYFQKYGKHSAVKLFKEIESHLSFDELISLVLYHSEIPRLSQLHDYPHLLTWKLESAHLHSRARSYMKALGEFYKKSKFEKFWLDHSNEYEEAVSQVRNAYEKPDIVKLVEDYYGAPVSTNLKCVVSLLMPAGYVLSRRIEAEETTYYIIGSSVMGDSSFVPIRAEYFVDVGLDEFGHSHIDSLTVKYKPEVDKRSWLFDCLDHQGILKKQFYNWTLCLNDHVVKATKARMYLAVKGRGEAVRFIINEEEKGFKLLSCLFDELEHYEKNRDKYPSFVSFYPVLLNSLDNFEPVNERVPTLRVMTHQDGRYVVIDFVYPKSAAEEAGLKVGDKILGIDGVPINSKKQLSDAINSKKIDTTMKVLIDRDGAKSEIPVSIDYEYTVFRRKQTPKAPKLRRRTYY